MDHDARGGDPMPADFPGPLPSEHVERHVRRGKRRLWRRDQREPLGPPDVHLRLEGSIEIVGAHGRRAHHPHDRIDEQLAEGSLAELGGIAAERLSEHLLGDECRERAGAPLEDDPPVGVGIADPVDDAAEGDRSAVFRAAEEAIGVGLDDVGQHRGAMVHHRPRPEPGGDVVVERDSLDLHVVAHPHIGRRPVTLPKTAGRRPGEVHAQAGRVVLHDQFGFAAKRDHAPDPNLRAAGQHLGRERPHLADREQISGQCLPRRGRPRQALPEQAADKAYQREPTAAATVAPLHGHAAHRHASSLPGHPDRACRTRPTADCPLILD